MQAVDPAELLAMTGTGDGQPTALTEVARDASARLRAALDSLTTAG